MELITDFTTHRYPSTAIDISVFIRLFGSRQLHDQCSYVTMRNINAKNKQTNTMYAMLRNND